MAKSKGVSKSAKAAEARAAAAAAAAQEAANNLQKNLSVDLSADNLGQVVAGGTAQEVANAGAQPGMKKRRSASPLSAQLGLTV